MSEKTNKKMREYLNASSITSLCRGHCEVLRKHLSADFNSIILQSNALSLAFVVPDDFRKFFNESLLNIFFQITKMQNQKTLRLLDSVKKSLRDDKKEFDILNG